MTDWNKHLLRASRPLALSTLSLDKPLRHSMTYGILTLQALNEVESSMPWPPVERRRVIRAFAQLTGDPSVERAVAVVAALGAGRCLGTGLPELVTRLPDLVACIDELPGSSRAAIWRHAATAAEQRLAFVMRARPDGNVVLRNPTELAGYCHLRRGIAAELITDLLVAHEPCLAGVAGDLLEMASPSAQGIGLMDYLDAQGAEHPCPIRILDPLVLDDLLDMADASMERAQRYVQVLREAGASRDLVAFASLPLAWAKSRLDRVHWNQASCVASPSPSPPRPHTQRRLGLS